MLLEQYLAAVKARKIAQKEEDALYAQLYASAQSGTPVEGTHLEKVVKYKLADKLALHQYIYEHNAIDLLQARLTESAVRLRLEDGITVPGIRIEFEDKLIIEE